MITIRIEIISEWFSALCFIWMIFCSKFHFQYNRDCNSCHLTVRRMLLAVSQRWKSKKWPKSNYFWKFIGIYIVITLLIIIFFKFYLHAMRVFEFKDSGCIVNQSSNDIYHIFFCSQINIRSCCCLFNDHLCIRLYSKSDIRIQVFSTTIL